jgi:hypothetical protein
MDVQLFLKNRAEVSEECLRPYWGMWVAFSPDGRSIVAFGKTCEELDANVVANGLNPEEVWFERVADEEIEIGGAQFL